jgi:hypothetical protein
MNLLPNYTNAILPDEKLTGYLLNPFHIVGKHKYRLFAKIFGITEYDHQLLKQTILEKIGKFDCEILETNEFGTKYSVVMSLLINGRIGIVNTIWIVKNMDTIPVFVTAIPLK